MEILRANGLRIHLDSPIGSGLRKIFKKELINLGVGHWDNGNYIIIYSNSQLRNRTVTPGS